LGFIDARHSASPVVGIKAPGRGRVLDRCCDRSGLLVCIADRAGRSGNSSARLHPEDIRGIVSQVAPASVSELALWLALAISAGICEELIFRGYLQQQFAAITRRVWLGILISAVFFGLAHGYEGRSGMLLIALYGCFFGVLAHWRGSLRPGIFAHAWHDSVSGVVLYFGNHLLHRIPH
jgi:membrane protease YdiL (CAAX protease family)